VESIADQLERLENLRNKGSISEHEFMAAKAQVLAGNKSAMPPVKGHQSKDGQVFGFDEKSWCTMMHISQLLIFAGGIGIVVPIIMWAMSKDHSPYVQTHGNRMMNWIISSLIATAIAGVLCAVLIGFPILLVLLVLDVAFPVIAALKANEREIWKYPLAFRFFPEE